MSAPETFAGRDLRAIASRMEARHAGTFEQRVAELDAAHLRTIASAIDNAQRPRSQREREGDARRAAMVGAAVGGLWATFRRLWSRAA